MTNQKTILAYLNTLHDQGYVISNVDWSNGMISVIIPAYPSNDLTEEEQAACSVSKIEGIRKIRSTRNMSLREAKEFAERFFDFD